MTSCEEVNSGKSHNLIKLISWISFSKSSFPSFPILPVRSLMSCILPLLFSIPVFLSLLFHFLPHMWFCSSSLCTLALPLLHCHPSLTYGFPLRGCVCVFGVTQSSVGLPANLYVCFADDARAMARVCLQAYGLTLCRVQQVMQQFLNDPQMRNFTLSVCQSFVLPSSECTTGGGTAGFGPRTRTCAGNCS